MKFLFTLTFAAIMMHPVRGHAFMGLDISGPGNVSNCMLVIRQCWKQDIEDSRVNDTLCTLSESELEPVYAALDAYVQAVHQQRVAFMLNLLAGDRPACEVITTPPLEEAPQNYTANCAVRFQAVYAAWQKYADCAVRMHCPAPSLQGNSTPEARDAMQLMHQSHFEQFLTLLTGGLAR